MTGFQSHFKHPISMFCIKQWLVSGGMNRFKSLKQENYIHDTDLNICLLSYKTDKPGSLHQLTRLACCSNIKGCAFGIILVFYEHMRNTTYKHDDVVTK